MSLYCIGDLHGRYDLLEQALETIRFTPGKDRMYLLGDVIDAGDESVRILQLLMRHPHSFTLILGNHESNFLRSLFVYDLLLSSRTTRQCTERVLNTFQQSEFELIRPVLSATHSPLTAEATILCHPTVLSWLSGSMQRAEMLSAMLALMGAIGWDSEKFCHIYRSILGAKSYPKIRRFLYELLRTDDGIYRQIKVYLAACEREMKFTYRGMKFWLRHDNYVETVPEKPSAFPRVFHHIQNQNCRGRYLLYGHERVGSLQQKLDTCLSRSGLPFRFGFDGIGIFAYRDGMGNHYFNLDLVESGLVGVLRLDDLTEYYVGSTTAPMPGMADRAAAYRDGYRVVARTEDDSRVQLLTYSNHCMEFLVCLDRSKGELLYLRADKADRSDFKPLTIHLPNPMLSYAEAVQLIPGQDPMPPTGK